MFVEKRASEIFYRYHQFRRTDGDGWLGASETISSCSVRIIDSSNVNVSSSMVDNVTVYEDTQISYRLKGGTSGKTYTIDITVVTSESQTFEDSIKLKVL